MAWHVQLPSSQLFLYFQTVHSFGFIDRKRRGAIRRDLVPSSSLFRRDSKSRLTDYFSLSRYIAQIGESSKCVSMASSFSSTASASSIAKSNSSSSAYLPASHGHNRSPSKVSFRLSSKPKLLFSVKGLKSGWNRPCIVKAQAQPTKVVVDEKLESSTKDLKPSEDQSSPILASEETISEFITQVSNIVKLVDSKDIVELQLKQVDFELLIRKKEAIPVPASSSPAVMLHASPQVASPAYQTPALPATPIAPVPRPATPALPPAPKASKSSHPPLKSPMAGTFYRSPAPGEPPFVKVGDKVQKGQVLCIIEAMKLMNEIEADQSGTIVEIVAEDGKPVSFETPLYVIAP